MENDRLWASIQQLENEKRDILSGKEYRRGASVSKLLNDIKHIQFKSLVSTIHQSIRAKQIRKKFNYDFYREDVVDFSKLPELYKKLKVVMYSAVIGRYDDIQVPLLVPDNVRYVLYTDLPQLYERYASIIEIRVIPESILKMGPILANRYLKFHPHEFFEHDEISIYMDGNVRAVMNLQTMCQAINKTTGLAMHRHADRDCIYDEAEVCICLKRGNFRAIREQIDSYRDAQFPRHFGLNEATVIVSDLRNNMATKLLNDWWVEFSNSKSLRDQIAWPYVVWNNDLTIHDIGNLGYGVSNNMLIELHRHK